MQVEDINGNFLKPIADSASLVKHVGSAFTHQKWIRTENKEKREKIGIFIN